MASEGDIVLSYFDTCLRTSDVSLLRGHKWLNDNLIGFWFDYLENDLYRDVSEGIAFLSPNVVQFIKSATLKQNVSDVRSMLSTMSLKEKRLVIIPINDCKPDQTEMGGTHWSLLAFKAAKQTFEHYDSHTGSINRSHAESIVEILSPVLMADQVTDVDLDLIEMQCTQQDNNYDCGIHLICNTEAICRKLFRDDDRHICDICSPKAISRARRDLFDLIYSLRNKVTNKDTSEAMS